MTEIARFDRDMDGSMEPSEHGQWVRYQDVQQRTWVGLTDEEIEILSDEAEGNTWTAVELAEAKLRKKNNG